MNITPIRTEQDYQQALQAIEPFFDREEELTAEELDYFDVMVSLIENYEKSIIKLIYLSRFPQSNSEWNSKG